MENFFKNTKNKLLTGALAIGLGMTPMASHGQETAADSSLNKPTVEAVDSVLQNIINKISSTDPTIENWYEIKNEIDTNKSIRNLATESLIDQAAKNKLDLLDNAMHGFLDRVYAEKSPFAEFPGELRFRLNPGYELSIPDDDGRKIFNLVMNNQFTYQSVDDGGMTEMNDRGFVISADPELQFKNDQGSVYIRFTINNGEIESFFTQINTMGAKEASYHFNALKSGASRSPNDSYEIVKQAFLSIMKK